MGNVWFYFILAFQGVGRLYYLLTIEYLYFKVQWIPFCNNSEQGATKLHVAVWTKYKTLKRKIHHINQTTILNTPSFLFTSRNSLNLSWNTLFMYMFSEWRCNKRSQYYKLWWIRSKLIIVASLISKNPIKSGKTAVFVLWYLFNIREPMKFYAFWEQR